MIKLNNKRYLWLINKKKYKKNNKKKYKILKKYVNSKKNITKI